MEEHPSAAAAESSDTGVDAKADAPAQPSATAAGYPAASAQAEAEESDAVPPPPEPVAPRGAGRKRATVVLPEPEEAEGPTYYRIGIDHEYGPDDTEIHFQCTRIKKLENLEAAGPKLKKLILIANCIEKIENLQTNVSLEHLELYQNLVKKIDNISHLKHLTVLDLSFNKIRSSASLASCCFEQLTELYLSGNKISDIEGVSHFRNIRLLEFGSNRLRLVPPELEQLVNMEELWLGRNKIVSMAMPPFPKLQKMSMQSNRLEVWDATLFQNCSNLTHLYLGHNNLPDLPDEFALLTALEEVDLARNAITKVRPFPELVALKELWMNDAQIAELDEVKHLAAFPSLKTVYLERNPMHGLGDEAMENRYKEAILQAVPDLNQLDAIRLHMDITVITDGQEKKLLGIRKA